MAQLPATTSAKGVDVPERITRAILAAKAQWDHDHPDRPNSFTLGRAIEAARAQWRLEPQFKGKAANGRDVLFDAIAKAGGISLKELNRPSAAAIAGAKKDILEASPDVTPEEVFRRARRYAAKYKGAACTPRALAGHWGEFPQPNKDDQTPTIYDEPVGWHAALSALSERSKWDRATTQLMLTSPWLELSATIRETILQELAP